MKLLPRLATASALALLGACGSAEERPFNEQFNSTFEGLESKAEALEAEADNMVDARAAELDAQAQALANRPDAQANLGAEGNAAAGE